MHLLDVSHPSVTVPTVTSPPRRSVVTEHAEILLIRQGCDLDSACPRQTNQRSIHDRAMKSHCH